MGAKLSAEHPSLVDLLILCQLLLAEAGAPSATPKGATPLVEQPER